MKDIQHTKAAAATGPNLPAAHRSSWQKDFLSSVVTFLVALPLCMGIALASGVPITAGIITGIIGGLIVGAFAGAPLQVSGPAAGLTVLVIEVVREHGIAALGVVVLIGGALQLLAGVLRLGQWFRAVSPAVVHGMLSGIGVLIFASQFHVMVDDRPRDSGLQNLATIPEAIQKGLPWPTLGTENERQLRAQYLHEIGQLHERQSELHAQITLWVTRNGTEAEHQAQAEHIATLHKDQQVLMSDLQTEGSALLASADRLNWADREAIRQAFESAVSTLKVADEDLLGKHWQTAATSQKNAAAAMAELLGKLKNHDWAAKIGLLTIVVLLVWQILPIKFLKAIPGPLVAVITATSIAAFLSLPVLYVEVPANLTDGMSFVSWNAVTDVGITQLLITGAMIAVIASAETLLCATAVDQMHSGPRTKYNQELVAQGVGNMLCGLVGALPMTGVIVRSAANVQAGATSRLSTMLHGLWLLVFVVVLGFLLQLIPTACLAAILVYTGYKLINPKTVVELWHYGISEVAIYLTVVTLVVVEDLLTGVVVGVVLSALKLLVTFAQLHTELEMDESGKRAVLHLEGAATFLRLPMLAKDLERIPRGLQVRLETKKLSYLDHACLDLLENWAKQHGAQGGEVEADWKALEHLQLGRHAVQAPRDLSTMVIDGLPDEEPKTRRQREHAAAAER